MKTNPMNTPNIAIEPSLTDITATTSSTSADHQNEVRAAILQRMKHELATEQPQDPETTKRITALLKFLKERRGDPQASGHACGFRSMRDRVNDAKKRGAASFHKNFP